MAKPTGSRATGTRLLRGGGPALLALAIAACGAQPPAPSAAEPTPGPTAASAAPPTQAPGASGAPGPGDAGGMAAGTEVLVVADELRLRVEPGTAADMATELPWGSAGVVRAGPVEADGYAWYEVEVDGQSGWAAAGDDEDPWLVPVGPAPNGGALLSFSQRCDAVPPVTLPTTTILADGSVVLGPSDLRIGRLNDEGMATIRAEVLELPVLQRPGRYDPERLPGAEPPGHGACLYTFEVGDGADAITVDAVNWFGDEEEAEFYVPSPERRLLTNVARSLSEIDSVLDERLWAELPRTYVATEFLLVLFPFPGPAGDDAIAYEVLGLPKPDELDAFTGERRCAVVSLEEAVVATRAIRTAGNPVGINGMPSAAADDGGQSWSLIMAPRTPAGLPACDDANG